jgi:hypothetical protein
MTRRPLRLLALLAALALWPAPVFAGADACDKIKDADAYNSCLASFGPVAGPHKVTAAPAADDAPKAARRRGRRPERSAHAPKRRANGRVRIEIIPR